MHLRIVSEEDREGRGEEGGEGGEEGPVGRVEEGEAEVGEGGGAGGVIGGVRGLAGGRGEEGGEVLLQLVVRVGGARVLHCRAPAPSISSGSAALRSPEKQLWAEASPSSLVERQMNPTVQMIRSISRVGGRARYGPLSPTNRVQQPIQHIRPAHTTESTYPHKNALSLIFSLINHETIYKSPINYFFFIRGTTCQWLLFLTILTDFID